MHYLLVSFCSQFAIKGGGLNIKSSVSVLCSAMVKVRTQYLLLVVSHLYGATKLCTVHLETKNGKPINWLTVCTILRIVEASLR